MVYVFEGPRNSGKTFISKLISEKFNIQRYQFSFADYFSRLGLESQNSKEAHAFSIGKELMLMQLFKDLVPVESNGNVFSFIHDRGILTVLAWGIMEGRISESEMDDQIKLIKDFNLMENIEIIFLYGDNPNKNNRNKDQWDRIDGDSKEIESYLKVISVFEKYEIAKINRFLNTFDETSIQNITKNFKKILSK